MVEGPRGLLSLGGVTRDPGGGLSRVCCTGVSACNATQQGALVGSYTDGIGMQDIDGVTLVAGEVRSYVEGLQLASGWLTGNHPLTGGVITYMRQGGEDVPV